MVWCVFWFAPAIFSLTGLVILVRHGLCAARLLAEPPLTARWIVPERVRATRRFPIAWTTVSRFCSTAPLFLTLRQPESARRLSLDQLPKPLG